MDKRRPSIFDQYNEWQRKKLERKAELDHARKLAEIRNPSDAYTSQKQSQGQASPDDSSTELERRIAARKLMLEEYKSACGSVSNRRIYNARNSGIYKAQFSKWVNGILPDSSATTINFERFLREKKQPIPRKPRS